AQSMYTYYEYHKPLGDPAKNPTDLNSNAERKNILGSLKQLTTNYGDYVNRLIGGLDIQSTNGLRYYFDLPVFNKSSRTQEMLGHGTEAPVRADGDYHSYERGGTRYERNKTNVNDVYIYPYAWLLTAIVGEDYIDFDNVPGPSDGDIGYWVKFRYVKAADNYRWRMPFTGMNHFPGLLQKTDDDVYSVSSGTKEIYYLSEVESSNYLCKYEYKKRFDGIDAANFDNGEAYNMLKEQEPAFSASNLGSNYQFAVTKIDLYKKHYNGTNSAIQSNVTKKIIKSTVFKYDYSTSSKVPNSMQTYSSGNPANIYNVAKSSVPYYMDISQTPDCSGLSNTQNPPSSSNIGSGKLTLRKVQHYAYDESGTNPTALPSYTFDYFGDCHPQYNPAYDRHAVDQWGNYMAGAANSVNNINYYQHFTEYIKDKADDNARVFKLKNINLPSGGRMNINYEAQSYGFVENQPQSDLRGYARAPN
ncbi:MAG TPA: hypothetical protein VLB84_15745, partial [Bacteroidia bacterium]|nr:hypothetical protein [Bacteroidia bacterium]